MNKRINIATILFIIIPSLVGFSQEKPTSSWNLKDCIDYARKNNIQVQSARVSRHKRGFIAGQGATFPLVDL